MSEHKTSLRKTLEELAGSLTDDQMKAAERHRESLSPEWENKIMYEQAELPLKTEESDQASIYHFTKAHHDTALGMVDEHLGKGDDANDENIHDILEGYVLQHVKNIGPEGKAAAAIYDVTDFDSEDERQSELLKLMKEHLGIDVQRNQAQAQKYQQVVTGLKAGERKEQMEALEALKEEFKKGLMTRHKQVRQYEFQAALPTEIQRSAVHLKYAAESDVIELPGDEEKFQDLYKRGEGAHEGIVSDILNQRRQEKLQERVSGVKYKRAG